ncbi:hypothetical protein BVRB_9g222810 [Beta vulgaris subsp. vulgaris]|nr:hypothetical protein BVRB_9g222810 [Beta vulgaris subsp. vulgaris]
MALASYSCKLILPSNAQELHDQGKDNTDESTAKSVGSNITGRRRLFISSTAATALVAATIEANDSKTALLQRYLKKSEENKVKNDKERLDGYYKRNYKDYFGFAEGSLKAKDKEQLSESERGILDWLEKNK